MKGSWKDNNILIKLNEGKRDLPAEGHLTFESMKDADTVYGYLKTVEDNLGLEVSALSGFLEVIIRFRSSNLRKDEEEILNMIDMATGCWPEEYNFTYIDEK